MGPVTPLPVNVSKTSRISVTLAPRRPAANRHSHEEEGLGNELLLHLRPEQVPPFPGCGVVPVAEVRLAETTGIGGRPARAKRGPSLDVVVDVDGARRRVCNYLWSPPGPDSMEETEVVGLARSDEEGVEPEVEHGLLVAEKTFQLFFFLGIR